MSPKVYLCGPINGCTDQEATEWREYAKEHLLLETLDPMGRDYRGREAENTYNIVENDKDDIDECPILLVNHPRPSTGTDMAIDQVTAPMEVMYAWIQGKQIIAVVPQGTVVSPWLSHHATGLFTSMDDAINYINTNWGRNYRG